MSVKDLRFDLTCEFIIFRDLIKIGNGDLDMIQVYLSISDLSKRFDLRFAHHWYIRTENVAQGIETCQDQDNIPHQTDY